MITRLIKIPHFVLLSLLMTSTTSVSAESIQAQSAIHAVTVYPGSAKITRVSQIKLAKGSNDVVITKLPLNLIETSLRVSGEGKGNISLGSVELSRDIQKEVVQEQEKQIREKITNLQEQRQINNDDITRNQSQLRYIQNMALSGNSGKEAEKQNGSYINLPIDQWQQAWQTLEEATQRVQDKIRQSKKKVKENDKLLNQLKRELQQVATNQKESRAASFTIEADQATTLELTLTYQINGARWEPVYDADLNTETGDINLKTLAQISQRTGEDWSKVNVTLSTLRPSAGTQLPSLQPWVIDFMPDRVYADTINYENISKSSAEFDNNIALQAEPVPSPKVMRKSKPMRQQQSRLISTDFSAEYKVPGVISLNSGSNKRRFALNTHTLSSSIKLASSPRFDPRAMILATAKYQQSSPLISGNMSLYRNGNYVGNTFLQQKLSGEELKLSFGEDDKVKITFLPDPDKKRKDGILFGKKKVVERHYTVNINSNHSNPYKITLSDVIPVSSDENIKVKSLGDLPTSVDVDDKKGVINWNITLKPQQEMKMNYGYSVSFPVDRQVLGL